MTETVDNHHRNNQHRNNQHRIGWRAKLLLAVAGGLGAVSLLESVVLSGNLAAFWAVMQGRQLSATEDSSINTAETIDELVWIAVALAALACAAGAGRHRVGLTWGSTPRQARLLGDWMLVFGIAMTVTGIVVVQLIQLAGGKGVGNDNLDINAVPTWFLVLKSINAGITEEILVVAVAWRLMELIPTRLGKPAFVMTGAATAILIGLRMSYHLYMGLPILYIVVLGWLTVRFYRHTRSLGPIIAVHILWDILVLPIVPIPLPPEVLLVLVGGLLVWIFTTGPAPFGFHFGLRLGREDHQPTGHLPYRFATWRERTAPSAPNPDPGPSTSTSRNPETEAETSR